MPPVESIRAAVNAARAGDTVLVQAGAHRERATVETSGLTPRGVGPRRLIVPPEKKAAQGTVGLCSLATDRLTVQRASAEKNGRSVTRTSTASRRGDENWITGNAPADLDHQNAVKGSNLFRGNFCRVSMLAGLC
ncbi:hypothetical protein ABT075_46120 [Streptomyces sp. NPDC002677]|uniref:hypothetical protein n=1 Tax=Streptomyces sp. NPDC002677 TaxID=3154774 RepID=UPI00332ED973